MKKYKLAVVGSGVSGLSAAWLLSQKHDVTLIEADGRLGGHAHTVDVKTVHGTVAIDTGFIVSNTWTYQNFASLVNYLDVSMVDTPMTFSVSTHGGRYEYSGNHLGTLLGSSRQWFSPSHWRMIADLVRFYRGAEEHALQVSDEMTLGQYLVREGFGQTFIHRHILPMAGAIWSSTPDEIAAYPFRAFVNFFSNHKLFVLGNRPDWRSVKGGSRQYIRKLVEDSRFETRLSTPVSRIDRAKHDVTVQFSNGTAETFDHVVLATHADQALRLLDQPSADELELLSPFHTSLNKVYLHRDAQLMPRSKRFWSGWNYTGNGEGDEAKLAVTYWMNSLQQLDGPTQHFVSLNPSVAPRAALVDGNYHYRHPIFTHATLEAQKHLWELQGQNRTWFCGAWFGAGFHEDGIQAGLAVAEQLGGMVRPWTVAEPSSRIHVHDIAIASEVAMAQAAE